MEDAEDVEDMKMDKEDAYMDSTEDDPEEWTLSSEEEDHRKEEFGGY